MSKNNKLIPISSLIAEITESKKPLNESINGNYDEYDEVVDNSFEGSISIIEFAIINNFLFKTLSNEINGIKCDSYGFSESETGRITFGGSYSNISPWWFNAKWNKINDSVIFQTREFKNGYDQLCHTFSIGCKNGLTGKEYKELFKEFRSIAYNNSEYKGKCLKVRLFEGRFEDIEIIDTSDFNKEIILNDTQNRFLKHFVNRIKRGNTVRYLLNGKPGCGKTHGIRNIIYNLRNEATFIIPDFHDIKDLTQILESCSIFDPGVLIIDDIDLYLGSRDKGGYSSILGSFLSFFDGVKKNRISMLCSTNDKSLVDSAAERPGRFNMILDYGYLTNDQIEEVCKLHLDSNLLIPEVFKSLKGKNISGAFIANLGENLREMANDYEDWTIDDVILMIEESYRGFYNSQLKSDGNIGFNVKNR